MSEDERRLFPWLRTRRSLLRIALRAMAGAAPALALAAFASVPLAVKVGLLLAGLVPALLAPIALWAEVQATDPGWVARRAALVAHAVATLALLAIPVQAGYTATALEAGPNAALDGLLASLSGNTPSDLVLPALVALAIGASLGGQLGERSLVRAAGGSPWESRARIQDGALVRTLAWCFVIGGAAVAVGFIRSTTREAPTFAAGATIWLLCTTLVAGVLALIGGVVSRVVLVIDVTCDALAERLARGAEAAPAPTDLTR